MKGLFFLVNCMMLVMGIGGCSDDEHSPLLIADVEGTWRITEVLSNDYWGGPLYWRGTDSGKQIRFTKQGYYEKVAQDFELVATYAILSDTEMKLTPKDADRSPYTLTYTFVDDRMILCKTQFEGPVSEKYELLFN